MERSVEINKLKGIRGINPQLFSLWVAMGSMIMFFGAFTSAYIVKQAAGNWLEFSIPTYFYWSTAAILISSYTLSKANKEFVAEKENSYKGYLIVSLLLGIVFIILQYLGWTHLFNNGIDFRLNVSGSFFYLITGAHAAHVLGGIAAIIVAILHAFTLKFKVTDRRINRLKLTTHYWHFVDALWIYLLLFLLIIK
jgi:cytochrome c oxidase subunit 3